MEEQQQPILTDIQRRVDLITLNRPKQLNALNDALTDALGDALWQFDDDNAIGVIVITGGAKAFAASADIATMADWNCMDVHQDDFLTRNWEARRRVCKPVIAMVAGIVMGGGCEMALACDLIIAAESARLELPEVKLAMLQGAGGTQRLQRAIGKVKAMDMCLSARVLDAQGADRGVQIHGGAGYINEYPVERFYRDVRLLRLYEGTSQAQHSSWGAN